MATEDLRTAPIIWAVCGEVHGALRREDTVATTTRPLSEDFLRTELADRLRKADLTSTFWFSSMWTATARRSKHLGPVAG